MPIISGDCSSPCAQHCFQYLPLLQNVRTPLPREVRAAHVVCFRWQRRLSAVITVFSELFREGGPLAAQVGQRPSSSSVADFAKVLCLKTTPDHDHHTRHSNTSTPRKRDPSWRIPVRMSLSGETTVQGVVSRTASRQSGAQEKGDDIVCAIEALHEDYRAAACRLPPSPLTGLWATSQRRQLLTAVSNCVFSLGATERA